MTGKPVGRIETVFQHQCHEIFGPTSQVHTTQPESPRDTLYATGWRISQARHPNFGMLVITNPVAIDMQQPRITCPSTAKSTSPRILNRCGDVQTHFCDPWYGQAKSHHAGYVGPTRTSCEASSTFRQVAIAAYVAMAVSLLRHYIRAVVGRGSNHCR
jgi:hypothetical protein